MKKAYELNQEGQWYEIELVYPWYYTDINSDIYPPLLNLIRGMFSSSIWIVHEEITGESWLETLEATATEMEI